ncbi:hypothetical protein FRX31_016669 [Thalictrum thalictroides]|uniref:Uncharacterized protein n=1 Tax=Thalictrum thalictroides TaxID=46969 RepID=A0A7J6WBI2_THATH|nr:hypothetical protein FRX31_016669 [Thalictrum thalictroides]
MVARQFDIAVDRQIGPQQPQISASSYITDISLIPSRWIPSEIGNVKINVDVSFFDATTPIGIGYLVKNLIGTFIFVGTESGHAGSAKEGEFAVANSKLPGKGSDRACNETFWTSIF